MVTIFAESKLDFKYRKFLGELTENYILLGFSGVLKLLFKSLKGAGNVYFHIRYLKWRGKFVTPIYYLLLVIICRFRGIDIVFTCHNFWEHNFKSRRTNRLVRNILIKRAKWILVLDELLESKIHQGKESIRAKVKTVHFSDFRDLFESQTEENHEFQGIYQNWLRGHDIEWPDVMLISASYRSIDQFKELMNSSTNRYLCIVPNVIAAAGFNSNVLVYHKGFVKKEVAELLSSSNTIGLIGLDNGSVATSLYMFASFGIPSLVLDREPMNHLVLKFKIGQVFNLEDNLDEKIMQIRSNYDQYAANCEEFLKIHSWEKSYEIHREIFK